LVGWLVVLVVVVVVVAAAVATVVIAAAAAAAVVRITTIVIKLQSICNKHVCSDVTFYLPDSLVSSPSSSTLFWFYSIFNNYLCYIISTKM
jgi:hypothetical protein